MTFIPNKFYKYRYILSVKEVNSNMKNCNFKKAVYGPKMWKTLQNKYLQNQCFEYKKNNKQSINSL